MKKMIILALLVMFLLATDAFASGRAFFGVRQRRVAFVPVQRVDFVPVRRFDFVPVQRVDFVPVPVRSVGFVPVHSPQFFIDPYTGRTFIR